MKKLTPSELKAILNYRINSEMLYRRDLREINLEEVREILRKNLKEIFKTHRFSNFWIMIDRDLRGVFYINTRNRRGFRVYPTMGENKVVQIEVEAMPRHRLPQDLSEWAEGRQGE